MRCISLNQKPVNVFEVALEIRGKLDDKLLGHRNCSVLLGRAALLDRLKRSSRIHYSAFYNIA
jgi:hypothetical protein